LSNKLVQYLWHAAGAAFIVETGSLFCWNTAHFWLPGAGALPIPSDKWFFLAAVIGAYAGASAIARRIVAMPLCGRMPSVLLGVFSSFLFSMTLIFTARAYYSRPFLIMASAVSFCWLYIGQRLFFSANQVRYGFTPGSIIQELKNEWRGNFVEIASPDSSEAFDALVVSPYQDRPLPPEWTRYITNMMIHGVPTVHPGTLYEFFIGRLPLKYMAEGPGVMIHPRGYFHLKFLCDWAMLVVLGLPALLCTGAVALAVLCFSGRPVFFVQQRIGKNGTPFPMVKFRSMTPAGEVTAIGRLLRKYRLDELPQIWNVLRGEMSFIGPRPETPDLTVVYTEEIPFYPYRYSILPGITGWAQVNYGYASLTRENKIKLSYDLYYVKHASLLLDILIVLKTIKTMAAGCGAK
jgi:lipopolysaccharide/colanic/teichoic acid biosynthesis glycosyltransferase